MLSARREGQLVSVVDFECGILRPGFVRHASFCFYRVLAKLALNGLLDAGMAVLASK